MNLWLDDIRPAPVGWVLVKDIQSAMLLLAQGIVENASLDHDLGACTNCMEGQIPNCPHVGTGYQLVCWMEETDNWPKNKPNVHSANPVGKSKMMAAINKKW